MSPITSDVRKESCQQNWMTFLGKRFIWKCDTNWVNSLNIRYFFQDPYIKFWFIDRIWWQNGTCNVRLLNRSDRNTSEWSDMKNKRIYLYFKKLLCGYRPQSCKQAVFREVFYLCIAMIAKWLWQKYQVFVSTIIVLVPTPWKSLRYECLNTCIYSNTHFHLWFSLYIHTYNNKMSFISFSFVLIRGICVFERRDYLLKPLSVSDVNKSSIQMCII